MGNAWTTAKIPKEVAGKTAIVTGANSGTGYYTALGLASAGAHVIIACRSKERGEEALRTLKEEVAQKQSKNNMSTNKNEETTLKCNTGGSLELQLLDLSSLTDVKRFADAFNKEGRALDILVNNAGIMKPPYSKSVDGFESQLATNHLGHFALVGHLMPSLLKSESPRVVAVASLAAWRGAKTPNTIHYNDDSAKLTTTTSTCTGEGKEEGSSSTAPTTTPDGQSVIDFVKSEKTYNADAVYGETKLANLLFMRELAKRHPKITAVAAHPGITASNLWQYNSKQDLLKKFMQSSENGALPLLRAATEPAAGLISGESYFAPRGCGWAGAPVAGWFPTLAKDDAYCKAYWEASAKATGVYY